MEITPEQLRDIYVAIEDWEAFNGRLQGRDFYVEFARRVNEFFNPVVA